MCSRASLSEGEPKVGDAGCQERQALQPLHGAATADRLRAVVDEEDLPAAVQLAQDRHAEGRPRSR
jgi:hypothetical protein